MKVTLTIEISDEALAKEGLTPEDALKQYEELQQELKDGCPDGHTITVQIEK